ncbi:MAG: hypothetical protein H7334_06990, partial [Ferruginibacter sp.]|nr:hypothetical protein [Ferruginibacter sp.]
MKKQLLLTMAFAITCLQTFTTVFAQVWSAPVMTSSTIAGPGGNIGTHSGTLIVNGNPAIAYYDLLHSSLVYVRATNAAGTTWGNPVLIDFDGDVGAYLSIVIIKGNPAIAYYDADNLALKYVRSVDIDGTSWGATVTLDASVSVGKYASLQNVNGYPAIAYYDETNTALKYIRAVDSTGATWGTAITLDATNIVGEYASMQIVDGMPAIAYYAQTGQSLKYIRATDANGSAWGTAQVVIAANAGTFVYLKVVNGNPSIAFHDKNNAILKYIRSNDIDGTAWAAPVTVYTNSSAGLGVSCLQIINNNPAISFWDYTTNSITYIRAVDNNGSSWAAASVTLGTGGTEMGVTCPLLFVGGKPAVAYYDYNNTALKYITADDASGTSWSASPLSFTDLPSIGTYTSLQIVNGMPAMAYFNDNSNLMYVRALDATGKTWGTPQLLDGAGMLPNSISGYNPSLRIVNGKPAIVYFGGNNPGFKYIYANDALGSTWAAPIQLFTGFNLGIMSDMQVISGNPAIVFTNATTKQLGYMRATDAAGTAWPAPVYLDNSGANDNIGPSLETVNGKPAIAYMDQNNRHLKYIAAKDATGIAWNVPVTLGVIGTFNDAPSLKIVNGFPAIAYNATGSKVNYVQANDADGATWAVPVTAAGANGQYSSLQVINGKPTIAYYAFGLKYVAASNVSGSAWGAVVTLSSVLFNGQYTSMVPIGSGAGIAYFNGHNFFPYFISSSSIVLPVTLSDIRAYQKNTGAQVEWTAQQESGIKNYIVQKSSNGSNFTDLGIVAAKNNGLVTVYALPDANPFNGINYYRLNIMDIDGTAKYSKIVSVNIGVMQSVTIYPNPVTGNNISLKINLP